MGKYVILIVAIIVVIIALVLLRGGPSALPPGEEEGATLEPTGNVDDAVAAILEDAGAIEAPAAEADSSLVEEDAQALTDFGAAFDASQL